MSPILSQQAGYERLMTLLLLRKGNKKEMYLALIYGTGFSNPTAFPLPTRVKQKKRLPTSILTTLFFAVSYLDYWDLSIRERDVRIKRSEADSTGRESKNRDRHCERKSEIDV